MPVMAMMSRIGFRTLGTLQTHESQHCSTLRGGFAGRSVTMMFWPGFTRPR